MNKKIIKGAICVALGASSYGVLATFVKQGGEAGFTTAELTFAQGMVGLVALFILNLFFNASTRNATVNRPTKRAKLKLMLGGVSLGLTSSFYYLSLKYIPVSVCIVLLMQSVWIGSILDFFITKQKPTKGKLFAILLVLIGTVLTTNVFATNIQLDLRGIFWGFLAGLSYSLALFSSNNIATRYHHITRSFYLMLGAAIILCAVWTTSLVQQFDVSVIWKWGILLALFGTILPPILFTKGMPIVGVGLGSIIASIELPVSVMFAYIILGEPVSLTQWLGIILILAAIILMNLSFFKPKNQAPKPAPLS